MTDPERDEEFQAFLKRRTLLPNALPGDDRLEPPSALDEIVLKKAREAVRSQQHPSRAPRWATPVALAATILLCLSIVLNVSLNTNRPAPNPQRTAATATAPNEAIPPEPRVGPGAPREESRLADSKASRQSTLAKSNVAQSRAPRPPTLAEAEAPGPGDSPAAARSAADQAATLAERAAPGAPSSAAARHPATTAPHPRDPKAWLQQIATLRAEGKAAQADAELQHFRAAFPGYPESVPDARPAGAASSEPPQ